MSSWDYIKKSIGSIADKTATKTREITDSASIKIKIATKEADRDAEYRVLGKLTYAKLKGTKGSDSITEHISESIEKLDKINAELAALKKEEKRRREAKEAAKKAEEAKAKEEEELIMTQFNDARRAADVEYEKAKAAAREAKNT